MSLRAIVEATTIPNTVASLADDLAALGVRPGAVILVHISLRSLGWVCGGPVAVIEALLTAIGPAGTLVMPAQSGDLSEPSEWRAPPVPEAWLDTIRSTMPAYDPARTPTRGMGAVAELFRTWPGVERSLHPLASFAALGPQASRIVAGHALESPFGEASPLARLYDLDAAILLLGVGYDKCTALHLAQCRATPPPKRVSAGAPIMVDGQRRWVRYEAPAADPGDFPAIGEALVAQAIPRVGRVGAAGAHHLSLRRAVDFGVEWCGSARTAGSG